MAQNLKNPSEWFAAGRIKATQLMPYFSSAVMGLVPFPMPGYGTLGVSDRGVLVWDPELAKKWTVENLAWVLLHEAGHYLRDHAGRRKAAAAEHHLWNIAGDAEINDDLKSAGAVFPSHTEEDLKELIEAGHMDKSDIGKPSGVLPETIGCEDGRLCEEYYEHLRKNAKVIKMTVVLAGNAKSSSGKGKGKNKGSGSSGSGKDKGLPAQVAKGCGSGSGAEGDPMEGLIPPSMGKSPAEQKRIQRQVAEAIRKEAERGRGTVPVGLVRWAEETLGPSRISWRTKLARVCRSAVAYRPGAGDYRYDRPSRRQGAFGYGTGSPVFPALRMPVPRCAIIADTSGSMGSDELKVAMEETKGILAAIGADVDFFACDAEVHSIKKIMRVQDATQALKGGGGTDMTPAFEAVQRLPRRPEVVVCITDGQIGDPGPKPKGMHVIWLVVGPYSNSKFPWGEAVEIPPGEAKKQEEEEDEAA